MKTPVKEMFYQKLQDGVRGGKLTPHPAARSVKNWRRVNHFKIGADPEFYLIGLKDELISSFDIGFRTGQAYGADNNGRLFEVRPAPSRSIVDVVAGTRLSLGLMYAAQPVTRRFRWGCSCWSGRDGVGGHIHFGRKFQKPMDLMGKLDLWMEALNRAEVVDTDLDRTYHRTSQRYGRFSDYRDQVHGFEYRTPPSWLSSPMQAHFVLTTAKLVPYTPHEVLYYLANRDENGRKRDSELGAQNRGIYNWLAIFSELDDDAALACEYIEKIGKLPSSSGRDDFRHAWELPLFGLSTQEYEGTYVPLDMCKVEEEDSEKMLEALRGRRNWELPKIEKYGSVLPNGYYPLALDVPRTWRWQELLVGLCGHTKRGLFIDEFPGLNLPRVGVRGDCFVGKKDDLEELLKKVLQKDRVKVTISNDVKGVLIPFQWGQGEGNITKDEVEEILTCGMFPAWRIKDVKEGCFEEWEKKKNGEIKETRKEKRELRKRISSFVFKKKENESGVSSDSTGRSYYIHPGAQGIIDSFSNIRTNSNSPPVVRDNSTEGER